MDKDKVKLQKSIRNSLAKQGVDFLVPFISSIVSILTSHDHSSIEVKKQLKKLIFKVEGLNHYAGFSFMETNKGIIVHDNVVDDSKPLAKDLKNLFTKNYKSPYAITDTFLNFINSDPKKKN